MIQEGELVGESLGKTLEMELIENGLDIIERLRKINSLISLEKNTLAYLNDFNAQYY